MTPLARALSGLPDAISKTMIALIYAGGLIALILTLGYEYADPIRYLDAR